MKMNNNSLNCLRHRILFVEEVQGQLLEVVDEFLQSSDGAALRLDGVSKDAFLGTASFDLVTETPIDVQYGRPVPCHFRIFTHIDANGKYSVDFARYWSEDGELQSEGYEHSGRFDPFHDDVSEVASNVMLTFMKEHSDNFISGMLTRHLTERIGKQRPNIGWEAPVQRL